MGKRTVSVCAASCMVPTGIATPESEIRLHHSILGSAYPRPLRKRLEVGANSEPAHPNSFMVVLQTNFLTAVCSVDD